MFTLVSTFGKSSCWCIIFRISNVVKSLEGIVVAGITQIIVNCAWNTGLHVPTSGSLVMATSDPMDCLPSVVAEIDSVVLVFG